MRFLRLQLVQLSRDMCRGCGKGPPLFVLGNVSHRSAHGCRYETDMNATLAAALKVSDANVARTSSGDVVLEYDSQEHYERITGRCVTVLLHVAEAWQFVWHLAVQWKAVSTSTCS